MTGKLINKNNLVSGDKIRFSYHDKQRVGTVEERWNDTPRCRAGFTLRHVDETGRKFSSFNFHKVDGRSPVSTGIDLLGQSQQHGCLVKAFFAPLRVTGLVGQFRIYGERLAPQPFLIQNILTGQLPVGRKVAEYRSKPVAVRHTNRGVCPNG